MEKLSVILITFNEAEHLQKCLDSVKGIADEIIVLDSFSTDDTRPISLAAGAHFHEHPFDGYISQKNRALSLARNNWVLSLDGDEALDELAVESIRQVLQEPDKDGYFINRRNQYCGRWMRFTSMYPDRKLRLFDRRKGQWTGYDPHDYLKLLPDGQTGRLAGEIRHWVIRDRADHLRKVAHFSTVAASAYFEQNHKGGPIAKYGHSLWRFFREYFVRLGFLEGKLGFQFACLSARYVFLKYHKLNKLYASRS